MSSGSLVRKRTRLPGVRRDRGSCRPWHHPILARSRLGDRRADLARAEGAADVGGGAALAPPPSAPRPRCAAPPPSSPRCSSIRPAVRIAPMGLATFLPGERRRRAVHGLEQAEPAGVDVARGRHAQAALQRRPPRSVTMSPNMLEVTMTCELRRARAPSAGRGCPRTGGRASISGILGGHLLEVALPQVVGVDEDVRLVGHHDLRAAVRRARTRRRGG